MNKTSRTNAVAFDTNVILRLMKEPNFADMLDTRGHLDDAVVHICHVVCREISEKDNRVSSVISTLKAKGATVVLGRITGEMHADAAAMEGRHAGLLHYPDSEILAYAKLVGINLMTCDKKLADAAKQELEGRRVVNPDQECGSGGRLHGRYDAYLHAHYRRHVRRPGSPPAAAPKRRRAKLRRRAAPRSQ